MMKQEVKNERGISLISLAVAIIVLIILTNIILYNMSGSLRLNKLEQMYNDVDNLRDKISVYYSQYGTIPIKIKYTNTSHITDISSVADTGSFYVIDLSALENVTLNYGQDYEKIKSMTEGILSDNTYTDLYIINEESHNIFYVAGIEMDGETFYTDDVADTVAVDLRYVDGIEIPDGYFYTGKNAEGKIQIVSNLDNTKTYTWNDNISDLPDSFTSEDVERVKYFKGYFKSDFDSSTIILQFETIKNAKKEGRAYDENTPLQDYYGNIVKVPEGFKIASDSADNVTEGIVIEDVNHYDTAESQFVWIPVGTVYKNEARTASETIELKRYNFDENGNPSEYSGDYIEEDSTDKANLKKYGNAIAKNINEFKTSTTDNKGYYIGRYEARVEKYSEPVVTENSNEETSWTGYTGGKLVEKGSSRVFNYITQNRASELSQKMYESSEFESDLMNSYAWDTAVLFVQTFDNRTDEVKSNANYVAKYSRQIRLYTSLANTGTNNLTDVSYQDKICNIWDMAGNCREWSTETYRDSGNPSVGRAGYYGDTNSNNVYTTSRIRTSITSSGGGYSFRPILYLK